MKKLPFVIALIAIALLIWVSKAHGATIETISITEVASLTSTYDTSFSVYYRGGSTTGGDEIRLARNTFQPVAGGNTDTFVAELLWTTPSVLGVSVDDSNNISAWANSTFAGTPTVGNPIPELPLTRFFNQVLILVHDRGEGGVSLTDISINGSPVRNMFADGYGANISRDIVSITNFGDGFDFSGTWDLGPAPNHDDQAVWIIALNNTSVPEPSTTLLLAFLSISVLALRRR